MKWRIFSISPCFFYNHSPSLLHLINGFKKKLLHFIRKFRLTLYQHVAMKFRHEVPFLAKGRFPSTFVCKKKGNQSQ